MQNYNTYGFILRGKYKTTETGTKQNKTKHLGHTAFHDYL